MESTPTAALYLDPILPLAITREPRRIPVVASAVPARAIVVAQMRSYRLVAAGNLRSASPSFVTAPGLFWQRANSELILKPVDRASNNRPAALPGSKSDERSAKAADWLLVIGQRLLDQVIVGAFGEPGYSRFLEAFAGAGSSPLGLGTEEIDTLFESAMSEVHDRRPAYRVRARSLLTEALLALYRATLAASTDAKSGGFRMASVIDYIELNYDGHIELESLAKMMATSPTHLSRVFRREIGVPLFEYLNRTRVRKACELLRRTDFSITQIAIEVGYNNVSFFNRYFRKVMRCSPREYRREMRE